MRIENFFTVNELENGLTNPDRVNELITMIQSEKDSTVNNFGQTTQLWSTVANTIAATENRNCLDLFIQLDGLFFVDKWLKDAQKLENNNENGFLEELLISLLRALEKLQRDNERLSGSEIGKTVQDLVAHSNSTVCEKAKELSDKWKLSQEKNIAPQEVDNLDHVDDVMDSEMKNQEPLDCADPSKSTNDNDGDSNTKSAGVGTLSSTVEQIASSADVDNMLESSMKTDVSGEKDDDIADDGESQKTSSNSDDDNGNVDVQINENSENGSGLIKLSADSKTSDMKLDYGMIDPLDIARQVAIEVERDVDSHERSCSTSEKTPDGEIEKPATSDPRNFQEIQSQSTPVGGSDKEVLPKPVKDAETLVSQISEVAQVSEPDTGRGSGFLGFDLNQEVCSEEVDNPVNPVSSTISLVSASRAAVAACAPIAPLQFEGALGWKGSASTSAFRAVPVSEISGTHTNKKPRLDFHDFDLNVAEDDGEDKTVFIPPGEESCVPNPRKPEKVQLDLNSIWNEQNGWQSPYHSSSSSSSSKQPSLKNIDLNLDQPVTPNGEESVISILGARFDVKRKDFIPQLQPKSDFNSGKLQESSMQYGNASSSLLYGHHQNGMFLNLPMYGSSSHGIPLPMPMPMPMPYMVDTRGTPFAQVIGPQPPPPFIMNMAAAGALSGSSGIGPPHRNFDMTAATAPSGSSGIGPPPFIMNMAAAGAPSGSSSIGPPFHNFDMTAAAAPSGSSSIGPPQHNFDMNTDLMVNGGSRQFFPQNGNQQASSNSVLGRRPVHDPDSEFFPVNQYQKPPWR